MRQRSTRINTPTLKSKLDKALRTTYLSGGAGNDLLVGGSGRDRLYGGAGRDRLRDNNRGNQLFDFLLRRWDIWKEA